MVVNGIGFTDLGPWEKKKNSNKQYKALYRVKSKKGCRKDAPFCFHKFKYFQGPPNNLTEGTFWKSRCSTPAPQLFPLCCDTENRGRAEYSVVRGYITQTVHLPISKAAGTCTVFAQHRCRCTESTPSCLESCEGDVLTLTRVTDWENQVVGVVRVEGHLACQVETMGWWFCRDVGFLSVQCFTPRPRLHLVRSPAPPPLCFMSVT